MRVLRVPGGTARLTFAGLLVRDTVGANRLLAWGLFRSLVAIAVGRRGTGLDGAAVAFLAFLSVAFALAAFVFAVLILAILAVG